MSITILRHVNVSFMTLDEITEEFLERYRLKERPDVEEYIARFPELAEEIRATLPALVIMEEFGLGSEDSALHQPRWTTPQVSQIGDYRILGEIGRGGMGIVYEAEQQSLGRRVALKVLPNMASDKSGLVRFRREARAAARLHHTNIVPVFDVGQDGDHAYYAMQLIQGQSLDAVIEDLKRLRGVPQFMREEPAANERHDSTPVRRLEGGEGSQGLARAMLTGQFQSDDFSRSSTGARAGGSELQADPPDENTDDLTAAKLAALPGYSDSSTSGGGSRQFYRSIARIGLQTADALAYAHARGIVHRDIKPSNVLLDAAGVVWVSDFGLAMTDDVGLTQTGDILGTLRYMSPERFQRQCDARADIYALGITLYELLVMKPAFRTADRLQLLQSIINDVPEKPSKHDPFVPLDLETVVLKAIEKDPRDRYPSASAMAHDLRQFIQDEPIKARRMTPGERLLRWSRRNKSLAASLSFAATLLMLLVGVLAWTSLHQAELRRVSEQRSARLQRNLYLSQMNIAGHAAAQRYGTDTVRARIAEWHPEKAGRDLRNWEWYYLYALSHREAFASEPLGNDFCWACDHSPDGNRIVNTVNAWGVQVRDAENGTVLADRFLRSARFVDWSPDGKKIAVGRFDDVCSILDAETLETLRDLTIPSTSEGFCVKWHPNSRWLAEVSESGDAEKRQEIRIHDTETGKPVWTLHGNELKGTHLSWHPDGTRLACSGGGQTKIWNLADGQPRFEAQTSGNWATWSPDGSMLAVDRPTGIWDAISERQLAGFPGPVCWGPASKQLAIGCYDGAIRIHDAETSVMRRVLRGHASVVWSMSWSRDGQWLASCGLRDETVRTWNLGELDNNQLLVGDTEQHLVKLADDGSRIAAAANYSVTIFVWDMSGNLRAKRDFPGYVGARAMNADGTRVALVPSKPVLTFWDTVADTVVEIPTEDTVDRLDWHEDGRLAGATQSGDIVIWDEAGHPISRIAGAHDDGVSYVDWQPGGSQLASTGADGSVKVWDAGTGQLLQRWEATLGIPGELRFSHDGSRLAAACPGAIVLWDAASGQRLAQFDEVRERFLAVDWSPDDSRIVAASDSSITLWDVASGRVALILDGPSTDLLNVRWSSDGMHIVAGGRRFVTIFDASRGYALNPSPELGSSHEAPLRDGD